jgi:hypothetical protein
VTVNIAHTVLQVDVGLTPGVSIRRVRVDIGRGIAGRPGVELNRVAGPFHSVWQSDTNYQTMYSSSKGRGLLTNTTVSGTVGSSVVIDSTTLVLVLERLVAVCIITVVGLDNTRLAVVGDLALAILGRVAGV